jgi:hypothetical protein
MAIVIVLLAVGTVFLMAGDMTSAQPAAAPNQAPTGILKTLEAQIDPQVTALLIIDMQNDYVSGQWQAWKGWGGCKKNTGICSCDEQPHHGGP